jgi:hypothetical protein
MTVKTDAQAALDDVAKARVAMNALVTPYRNWIPNVFLTQIDAIFSQLADAEKHIQAVIDAVP